MNRASLDFLAENGVRVYGDLDHIQAKRGPKDPHEDVEQVTFFNRIRAAHPDTWGRLALHPRNEGLRRGGQLGAIAKHKVEGMTPGASDIIIPARVAFVCELKRRDYTLCAWQDGQIEYLIAAASAGAFACVAFGCDAATEAFSDWARIIAQGNTGADAGAGNAL